MTAVLPLPLRVFVRVGLLILLGMFVIWLVKVLFVLAIFGLIGYTALCAILLIVGERPPSLTACTGWFRRILERVAGLVKHSLRQLEADVQSVLAYFSSPKEEKTSPVATGEPLAEAESLSIPQVQPVGLSRTRVVWWTCVEAACGGLVGLMAVGLAAVDRDMTGVRLGLSLGGAALVGTVLGALVSLGRPRNRPLERGE